MSNTVKVPETIVMLENVRGAFVHDLFTASTVEGQGKPAFSFTAIVKRDDNANIQKLLQGLLTAARNKWGPQGDAQYQALAAAGRICLRDGNAKPDVAGFPGNLTVGMRSPIQPKFFNEVPQEMTAAQAQASGKFYSGAYFNVSLAIWAQDNQYGKRLNAQVRGVQHVADGEPLGSGGGSVASVEEFGSVESSAAAANEFGSLFGGADQQASQASQQGDIPAAPVLGAVKNDIPV